MLVVTPDDGVVYEHYVGEFNADRVSLIASSSKMISAGVLLSLEEQGFLDLNSPIAGQVDWPTANPEVTPAQLISNSSGLVGLGPEIRYAPYICQWTSDLSLGDCGETIFTTTEDDADQALPDTDFRYGGAQWQVAGAVAEAVSGKPWSQLIDETYVQPCGLDSLGYIGLDGLLDDQFSYPSQFQGDPANVESSANPNIEAGGHISPVDYAELLLMHLRGGTCNENQVLTQESLDSMYTDRLSTIADGSFAGGNVGYGMGWWIERETGQINDGGAWGTLPWIDLEDDYGAVLVIEATSGIASEFRTEIDDLVEVIALAR